MVFQAYSLFPNMTARQNVEFGLRTRRVNKSEIESRVKKIFEIIELGSHIDRYPHQLSGGQQQRVALARAIVVRPKVLLLDEPLSALDAQVRDQLRDEIKRVQREFGITTLFVTHDQEEAMTISDRVGVMDKGRLLQIDTPQKVYAQPINPTVARFIGIMNEVPAVVSGNTVATLGSNFSLALESSFAPGSKNLKALIRPEAIEIIEPNHIGVPGKIISISFLGPIAMVQISLDRNLEIRAILPAAMINRYQVDQVVHVTSSAKSLIVAD
jgi:putative spermidine/putrescine transport system ATP-binding protein